MLAAQETQESHRRPPTDLFRAGPHVNHPKLSQINPDILDQTSDNTLEFQQNRAHPWDSGGGASADDATAQTYVTVVEHGVLTRGDAGIGKGQMDAAAL